MDQDKYERFSRAQVIPPEAWFDTGLSDEIWSILAMQSEETLPADLADAKPAGFLRQVEFLDNAGELVQSDQCVMIRATLTRVYRK